MRYTLRLALPLLIVAAVPLALWARHRSAMNESLRALGEARRRVVLGVYRPGGRIELPDGRTVPLTGERALRPDLEGRRVLIDADPRYAYLGRRYAPVVSYEVCCIHPLPEENIR